MAPAHPPKEVHPGATGATEAASGEQSADTKTSSDGEDTSNLKPTDQSAKRSSWYNTTWPRRKPAPITQVAQKSISSTSATTSQAASSIASSTVSQAKRQPSDRLTLRGTKSQRSLPAHATTTKVNAVSQSLVRSRSNSAGPARQRSKLKDMEDQRPKPKPKPKPNVTTDEACRNADSKSSPQTEKAKESSQTSAAAPPANGGGGWLEWFLKSSNETEEEERTSSPGSPRNTDSASKLPESPAQAHVGSQVLPSTPPPSSPVSTKRSWFQMWSGDISDSANTVTEDLPVDTNSTNFVETILTNTEVPAPPAEEVPSSFSADGSKTTGWVFWSRDRKADTSTAMSSEQRVGEIAVSGTPSQKRPRRTSLSLQDTKVRSPLEPPAAVAKIRGMPGVKERPASPSKDNRVPTPMQSSFEPSKDRITTPSSARFPPSDLSASKLLQASAPNLLLPPLYETFSLPQPAGLLQSLHRMLSYSRPPDSQHLNRIKDVPKVRNALAIGVHGYFPTPLIRSVLGQPTGTSIKFADMAAKAIKKWTEAHGYSCEVKTAALEGEGRIAERVELLWKLLLNWIDEIKKADFIMVACHSQGVPVAMMLIAKLISFGCVNSARISVCAMAGVSLGPFPDFKSRWISGTAGELFEFSNPSSIVSKDYVAAIEAGLRFGVRVLYVGSIDDQLVSLESSTFAPISHPHIYRAVFVDGRIHAPNFVVHLVGFALKLRNLGIQDHGLIRELSSPLAGSLYTGEGHSRIYEDDSVYDLAVAFTLETHPLRDLPLSQRFSPTPPSANPYILPWAVRGILEEDLVKSDLQDEARELLRQFDEWKPTTKVLKDVKFRLEGVRSKL